MPPWNGKVNGKVLGRGREDSTRDMVAQVPRVVCDSVKVPNLNPIVPNCEEGSVDPVNTVATRPKCTV
jgi:hypothetical protein